MASNIGAIAQLLDATLDPTQHRKGTLSASRDHEMSRLTRGTAESALKAEQTKSQYSLSLLNIVASDALPAKTRLAAALAFKNFIRNNYVVRQSSAQVRTPSALADRHAERRWKLQTAR